MRDCTLKVCPNTANRRLFQSRYTTGILNPEVLATLVPPAIERRPLCGLVGGTIADNHKDLCPKPKRCLSSLSSLSDTMLITSWLWWLRQCDYTLAFTASLWSINSATASNNSVGWSIYSAERSFYIVPLFVDVVPPSFGVLHHHICSHRHHAVITTVSVGVSTCYDGVTTVTTRKLQDNRTFF